jgi:hypothetical protein
MRLIHASAVQSLALVCLLLANCGPAALAENAANQGVPWPAADGLGRKLPLADEVGRPRPDRFVGLFYFLTHGRHGDRGPFDVSKILAQDPTAITNPASPLWGPLYANHHWGEPLFSYYVSEDESVLRKHAQMLADAGVDVIIFDVSNQLTYPESWRPLCRIFEEVRKAGGQTPQIAFLCPFWDPHKVVEELWEQLYRQGLYSDLWFRWQGKPLILADPAMIDDGQIHGESKTPERLAVAHTLGQAFAAQSPFSAVAAAMPTWTVTNSGVTLSLFSNGPSGTLLLTRRFEKVVDNAWVQLEASAPWPPGNYYLEASLPSGTIGWWGDAANSIPGGQAFADGQPRAGERDLRMVPAGPAAGPRAFFTFRKPQPDYFIGPTGPDQWGWLEVAPQHVFTNAAGDREEMTVGTAQNAVDGKLSCLSNPNSHGRSFQNGAEPPADRRDFTGHNFAEQWRTALAVDPEFIFITGWNEWTAMRFDHTAPFYGSGPVSFVDQFDEEFSRDIEPTAGGHGDAYYYQMIANIRRFKGVPAIPPIRSQPIILDGRFDDWSRVEPEYTDTPDDPVHRSSRGYGKGVHYDNQTGRNDFRAAKVSFDETNVYFYVRTQTPITPEGDPSWMLLFIDADQNPTTGWLGYDFVVNRVNVRPQTTTIERNLGGYRWGMPQDIPYRRVGNELELAIPRATLGLTNLPAGLDFKWADHIQQTGDASDFTLNGDVAPNDRFNYRATFTGTPANLK